MPQQTWRWCRKCEGLFFPPPEQSACPAGGFHDPYGSWIYYLVPDAPPAPNQQHNWRYCVRCRGLYYAGNITQGECPAPGGGAHDHTTSANYSLIHDLRQVGRQQEGWSRCTRCEGLFFTLNQTQGVDPRGGPHVGSGSYVLVVA